VQPAVVTRLVENSVVLAQTAQQRRQHERRKSRDHKYANVSSQELITVHSRRVASAELSRGFQATAKRSRNNYFVASATMDVRRRHATIGLQVVRDPGLERPG